MGYACTLEIESLDAQALVEALSLNEVYDRSTVSIKKDENKVFIKITAKDITALRAAVNDYIRLVRVCESLV